MKPMREEHFAILRRHMVDVIAIHVDLLSDELGQAELHEPVLAAMQNVPRHLFVPEQFAPLAYQDSPLPIGFDKTISQPFVNALMTDLLSVRHDDAVLEIGTGLGYQAALLAELADHVWTVEIVEEFATQAERLLHRLGYFGVTIRAGDGSRGWAEHAPYDKIMVTAAAREPPSALLDQLKPAGRLVLPVGDDDVQELTVVDKDRDGSIRSYAVIPVRFSRLETII